MQFPEQELKFYIQDVESYYQKKLCYNQLKINPIKEINLLPICLENL